MCWQFLDAIVLKIAFEDVQKLMISPPISRDPQISFFFCLYAVCKS